MELLQEFSAVALGDLASSIGDVAWAGVLGNTSHQRFAGLCKAVRLRKGWGADEPDHIARAVYNAHLNAIQEVAVEFDNLGDKNTIFAAETVAFCEAHKGLFSLKVDDEIASELSAHVEALLHEAISSQAEDGAQLLEDVALKQLDQHIRPDFPEGFEDHFRHGAEGGYRSYRKLLTGFLVRHLQHNKPFKTAFEALCQVRLTKNATEMNALVQQLIEHHDELLQSLDSIKSMIGVVMETQDELQIGFDKAEQAAQARHAEMMRMQKQLLAMTMLDKGIPCDQLLPLLEKLGQRDVPIEEYPSRFKKIVDDLIALKARLEANENGSNADRAIRLAVLDAIERGAYDEAKDRLEREFELLQTEQRANARKMVEILSLQVEICRVELRYYDGVNLLDKAAGLLDFSPDEAFAFRMDAVELLYDLGREYVDNDALRSAISRLTGLLVQKPREAHPREWADIQHRLGCLQTSLGERENSSERLKQAVASFDLALKERTQQRAARKWADTLTELGNALTNLGRRETGKDRFQRAVAACSSALQERDRERLPLEWAATQNYLGNALMNLGKREQGTETLERAVQAYSLALEEMTRDIDPVKWAKFQNNLGCALTALGEREVGTAHLEQAAQAFTSSLEVFTEDRFAVYWGWATDTLGDAYLLIAERDGNTATARKAVHCYQGAKQVLVDHAEMEHKRKLLEAKIDKANALMQRVG